MRASHYSGLAVNHNDSGVSHQRALRFNQTQCMTSALEFIQHIDGHIALYFQVIRAV